MAIAASSLTSTSRAITVCFVKERDLSQEAKEQLSGFVVVFAFRAADTKHFLVSHNLVSKHVGPALSF